MLERKTVSQCPTADYYMGWNDAVDAMPKWRNVKDPPIKDGAYLIVYRKIGGELRIAWDMFNAENGCWCMDGWNGRTYLYWMPFSELPKPEEE